ncbi:MAG: amidase [Myxococcota bacterium]
MHPIVAMDATELAASIRERSVSCVEVMRATLDQIERLNPRVNAIIALRERDALLADARACDDELARGENRGPLHGFPQAIKDLEPVRGLPTSMGGFAPLRSFVAPADGIMVERMRRAGAIFIGRTNAPEFGLGSHTYNKVHGATRNAYDPTRSAGGSSGGAAVALALRMLPVADGGDFGGSLRNPAGWNNVFSLRPSLGRVPSNARDAWLPSMAVLGPMARSVPDLALLYDVQAGYDARAPLSLDDAAPLSATLDLEREFAGARIAWSGDMNGYLPFEAGVLDTCRDALATFTELGCTVEEANPDFPIDDVWRAWLVLRGWLAGSALLDVYKSTALRAHMKPEAIFEVESGAKLSAYDVTAASIVRSRWYEAVHALFARYDFWILPTAQLFPFDIALDWPREIAGRRMDAYHEWMKVVLPVTMSGCPVVTAPAGFGANGLPMGLQIVARNRAERDGLELAHAYDRRTRWVERRPPTLLGV